MQSKIIKGCLSEQKIILKSLEKGFSVSKPLLPDSSYDLILDYKNKLNKVQIKSSYSFNKKENRYSVKCTGFNNKKYTKKDTDFIIIDITDDFYITPIEKITGKCVRIYKTSNGKYANFKNRWDLLK